MVDPPPTYDELVNALTKYPKAEHEWEALVILLKEAWESQTLRAAQCNSKISHIKEWVDTVKLNIE